MTTNCAVMLGNLSRQMSTKTFLKQDLLRASMELTRLVPLSMNANGLTWSQALVCQVESVKAIMRNASLDWLYEFYRAGGLQTIINRLAEIEARPEKGTYALVGLALSHQDREIEIPQPPGDDDLRLQSELLKCLKAAMNNPSIITSLMSGKHFHAGS